MAPRKHTGSEETELQYKYTRESTLVFHRSDGPQPHLINIEFMKKTAVRVRAMYQ